MPNKPDKFGIKYWFLTYVKSKYCLNAIPRCGKDDARISNQYLGEFVVLRLTVFCTRIPSGREFEKDQHNFRWNDKEKQTRITSFNSKTLGDILTDYHAKKNKNVLLLSTIHQDVIISDTQKRKPDQILFYNANKVGVDLMDIMSQKCSTGWATRRWPAH
ncbi:hypothetical protein J437_LFUL014677, partial [Ladona fulva]